MKTAVILLIIGLIGVLVFGTIDHRRIITFGQGSFIDKRVMIFRLKWNGLYKRMDFLLIASPNNMGSNSIEWEQPTNNQQN